MKTKTQKPTSPRIAQEPPPTNPLLTITTPEMEAGRNGDFSIDALLAMIRIVSLHYYPLCEHASLVIKPREGVPSAVIPVIGASLT